MYQISIEKQEHQVNKDSDISIKVEDSKLTKKKSFFYKIKQWSQKNWLVLIVWFLALVLRIISAIFSKGYIHPDEIYQSIEVVNYGIFGRGFIPWEFIEGARSWVYPGIVYIIFKIMIFFGATDIEIILIGVRLFSGLLSMSMVITAYFFGKELYNKKAGIFASLFIGIWYDFIFWSTRTMTDGIAVNFVFLAVYFGFRVKKSESWKQELSEIKTKKEIRDSFLAGLFLGIAYIFKFPTIIFGLPLLVWFLYQKRWRGVLCFISSVIIVVILHGVFDYFTWGTFFQSTIEFFEYNIISGKNAEHGAYPFYSYIAFFAYYYSIFSVLFLLFVSIGFKRNRGTILLVLASLFFIVIFSFISHKEYRFILPIMPLFSLIAGNGIVNYPKFIKMKRYKNWIYGFVVLIIATCSTVTGIFDITFQPNNNYCQAVKYASEQEDAEIVVVIGGAVFNSPGYSYFQGEAEFLFMRWRYTEYVADYLYPGKTIYFITLDSILEEHPKIITDLEGVNATLVRQFVGPRYYTEGIVAVYKRL